MSFLTVRRRRRRRRRGPQNFFFTFVVPIPERFAPRSQLRAFGHPLLPGLASLGIKKTSSQSNYKRLNWIKTGEDTKKCVTLFFFFTSSKAGQNCSFNEQLPLLLFLLFLRSEKNC